MFSIGGVKTAKERLWSQDFIKTAILVLLVLLCAGVTCYSHFILRTDVVFSHLFYVPVALAGLWFGRRGAWVAVLLGALLLISRLLSALGAPFQEDWLRSAMFVIVGLTVGLLREQGVRSEKNLRETRDYLDSLIRYANAPIIVWDPEGRITRFNVAFEQFTGYTAGEVIGRELSLLFPEASRDESLRAITRTLSGEYWESVEIPILRQDGDVRLAFWNSANIYAEDGATLLATIAQGQGITARKRAEEALATERSLLRTLVDHLPVAVYVKDVACRKTLANPADFHNMGAASEAEVLGKTDFDLFPHNLAAAFYADDQLVIQSGQPILNREEEVTRPDGTRGWQLTSKVPVRDGAGQVVGLVGIGHDITARKEAAEELRAYAIQLEASNRELQDFAYVASHDLREPLRKVQAFSERLQGRYGDVLDERGVDYLQRMNEAARRMQALIDSLLTLSRVQTNAQPLVPVDLAAAAREAVSDLEARIRDTGARVRVGELPTVDADPTQMRELFQNLIGNALKFHRPEEPPVVQVHGQLLDDEGGDTLLGRRCRVVVQDNGIGFDERYLDRIFRPFQRLHGRDEYEGVGMGLAICRKIAERHGGAITARSTPGQGATFIVALPVRQPNGVDEP